MSVVYVTQDVMVRDHDGALRRKFDLSSAEAYGEVRILVPHGQSLVSSVPVVRQLLDQLRGFTDEDYLLPLGDPAIMAAASGIAAKQANGRFTIQKWDRRAGKYLAVKLDLSGRPV